MNTYVDGYNYKGVANTYKFDRQRVGSTRLQYKVWAFKVDATDAVGGHGDPAS